MRWTVVIGIGVVVFGGLLCDAFWDFFIVGRMVTCWITFFDLLGFCS